MELLHRLEKEEESAIKTLREALAWKFPLGTRVSFKIMEGQVNPSTGVVTYHGNHGYLGVRHEQAKKHSRNTIRQVHFSNAQII